MKEDHMSEFLDAMQEAADILTGKRDPARAWHPPANVDVRAIRRRQKLTQEAFARRYGFTVGAVRDWEQGRYQPDQTARAYLLVIDREPEAVERALQATAA
jgi:putative transcriptional regulator